MRFKMRRKNRLASFTNQNALVDGGLFWDYIDQSFSSTKSQGLRKFANGMQQLRFDTFTKMATFSAKNGSWCRGHALPWHPSGFSMVKFQNPFLHWSHLTPPTLVLQWHCPDTIGPSRPSGSVSLSHIFVTPVSGSIIVPSGSQSQAGTRIIQTIIITRDVWNTDYDTMWLSQIYFLIVWAQTWQMAPCYECECILLHPKVLYVKDLVKDSNSNLKNNNKLNQ